MTPKKNFAIASRAMLGLAIILPAMAGDTLTVAPPAKTGAAGTQALEIPLPKPLFVGTPKNIKSKK